MPGPRTLERYSRIAHAPLSTYILKLDICRQYQEFDLDEMPPVPQVPSLLLEDLEESPRKEDCVALVSGSDAFAGCKDVWVQSITEQIAGIKLARDDLVHIDLVQNGDELVAHLQWPLASPASESGLAYSNLCATSGEVLWSHPADYEMINIPPVDFRMFSDAEAFGWRKVSVTNILHPRLYDRFLASKYALATKFSSFSNQALAECVPYSHRTQTGDKDADKKNLVRFLTQARISFHGGNAGFKDASHSNIVQTTTDVYIALGDSDWQTGSGPSKVKRILVCATLLGRTARVNDNHTVADGFSVPGSSAHADTLLTKEDWLHADAGQVLPLYEIEYVWTPQKQQHLDAYALHASGLLTGFDRARLPSEWCRVL
ncbi:hypothetical protein BU16DRAFT_590366 [Lophium mytilinum]|uniref:PARP catalytic domain-containing protein n=1 Tax=Lophium mytilinum TaxID=390894 RepID=A0A6A6QS60_9PEZI|nr:hypothetical protein BU16DRAFT_590366 [Lophium mytilinum]